MSIVFLEHDEVLRHYGIASRKGMFGLIEKAQERVLWGTNWPHGNIFEHGHTPNDGLLLDLMLDFAPDESTRNKILVDNPARLFGFDPL